MLGPLDYLLGLLVAGLIASFGWNLWLTLRVQGLERRLAAQAWAAPSQPVSQTETAAAPQAAPGGTPSLAALFEALVGGRLLIWVGGVALVVAAIFLIRLTIDLGLITPELRMIAAAAFGLALLALGEGMKISGWLSDDPRIRQALVGAGLAVLYATVYGSYILFGFIGPGVASALMVAITAAALALSLRHGIGTAAMGMIGGYLTPALVGDPDAGALPLLFYLVLLDAAVFWVAWRRGWSWLAGVAVLASFAWAASLLFGPLADAQAAGLFIVVLALAAALLRPAGAGLPWLQPLALGGVQLAILIGRTDTGALGWLLFGALGAAALALGRLRDHGTWAGLALLAIGVLMLPVEAAIDDRAWLAEATIGLTILFGVGGLLLMLERRCALWAVLACGGFSAPASTLRWVMPDALSEPGWGYLFALLAIGPAVMLWAGRDARSRMALDATTLAPAGTTAFLLALAAVDLVPGDLLSIAWLALAIVFIATGMRQSERSTRLAGLVLLTVTVLKLFLVDAAALEGVLRILSFFGLGAALIVLGRFYGALLRTERSTA